MIPHIDHKFILDIWTASALWVSCGAIGIWANMLKPEASVGLFAAKLPAQKLVWLLSVVCGAAASSFISTKSEHATWREAGVYTVVALAGIGMTWNRSYHQRRTVAAIKRGDPVERTVEQRRA